MTTLAREKLSYILNLLCVPFLILFILLSIISGVGSGPDPDDE